MVVEGVILRKFLLKNNNNNSGRRYLNILVTSQNRLEKMSHHIQKKKYINIIFLYLIFFNIIDIIC